MMTLYTIPVHEQICTYLFIYLFISDVGFNGINPTVGFVNNILNRYFTVYFPRAVTLALQLEYSGYVERLVYTTHPWLVSLYINCPSQMTLSGIKLAVSIELNLFFCCGLGHQYVFTIGKCGCMKKYCIKITNNK